MNKQEKAREIERLTEALRGGPSTIVLAAQGLTVNKTSELRRKIRATSSTYRVVKNRLALRALKETPLSDLAQYFRGPTSIAYYEGDPAALAKAIGDFARENKNLKIKGGLVDGRVVGQAEVQALADLPPRPQLMARFIGVLAAPMTRLVRVLQGPARSLARALDEIAKKKSSEEQKTGDPAPGS